MPAIIPMALEPGPWISAYGHVPFVEPTEEKSFIVGDISWGDILV
jgi:hypothetical protein